MTFELYLKNIKNLAHSMGLTHPIELDNNLGATFVCNQNGSLLLNIHYNLEKDLVTIDTLVATNMPSSRLGIQTIMNELIGDLLHHNNHFGRLVAYPEEFAVKFLKEIDLKEAHEMSLAETIPHFIHEALKWKTKFKSSLRAIFPSPRSIKPQEIVSFESF